MMKISNLSLRLNIKKGMVVFLVLFLFILISSFSFSDPTTKCKNKKFEEVIPYNSTHDCSCNFWDGDGCKFDFATGDYSTMPEDKIIEYWDKIEEHWDKLTDEQRTDVLRIRMGLPDDVKISDSENLKYDPETDSICRRDEPTKCVSFKDKDGKPIDRDKITEIKIGEDGIPVIISDPGSGDGSGHGSGHGSGDGSGDGSGSDTEGEGNEEGECGPGFVTWPGGCGGYIYDTASNGNKRFVQNSVDDRTGSANFKCKNGNWDYMDDGSCVVSKCKYGSRYDLKYFCENDVRKKTTRQDAEGEGCNPIEQNVSFPCNTGEICINQGQCHNCTYSNNYVSYSPQKYKCDTNGNRVEIKYKTPSNSNCLPEITPIPNFCEDGYKCEGNNGICVNITCNYNWNAVPNKFSCNETGGRMQEYKATSSVSGCDDLTEERPKPCDEGYKCEDTSTRDGDCIPKECKYETATDTYRCKPTDKFVRERRFDLSTDYKHCPSSIYKVDPSCSRPKVCDNNLCVNCELGSFQSTNNFICDKQGIRQQIQFRTVNPVGCDDNYKLVQDNCFGGQQCVGYGECSNVGSCGNVYGSWQDTDVYNCYNGVRIQKQTRTTTNSQFCNDVIRWVVDECEDNKVCVGQGLCLKNFTCGSVEVNWGNNNVCRGVTSFSSINQNVVVNNNNLNSYGIAHFKCNSDGWSLNHGSCSLIQPTQNSCSASDFFWGNGCSGKIEEGTFNYNNEVVVTNTNFLYTGTSTWRCSNNGFWQRINESCSSYNLAQELILKLKKDFFSIDIGNNLLIERKKHFLFLGLNSGNEFNNMPNVILSINDSKINLLSNRWRYYTIQGKRFLVANITEFENLENSNYLIKINATYNLIDNHVLSIEKQWNIIHRDYLEIPLVLLE
jgi:hypothetical protein